MIKENIIIGGLIGFILLLLAWVTYEMIQEQKQWDSFKAIHNCKVIGKEKGDVSVGMGTTNNGKYGTIIMSNPDKTGYKCDDGITYWR